MGCNICVNSPTVPHKLPLFIQRLRYTVQVPGLPPGLPDVAMQGFDKKDIPICFQWNKRHCFRPLCSYVPASEAPTGS